LSSVWCSTVGTSACGTAVRWAGAVVLAAGFAVAWVVAPDIRRGDLYLRGSYHSLSEGWVSGPVHHLVVLVVGLVGSAAILAITPRGSHWFAVVGRNSLTVYLLQAALIFPLKLNGTLHGYWDWYVTVAAVIAGFAGAALLGSPWVERGTRWLVRPPTGWLFEREKAAQPA